MLIGLTGFKSSGKSSVGDILSSQYGFTPLYFAEPVYQGVWELNPMICVNHRNNTYRRLQEIVEEIGWDKAKRTYPEVRRLLEVFGSEVGRNIVGIDTWVRILDEKYKDLPTGTDVVITDVRFVNEDWYVHNQGGTLWRIVRPNVGLEGNHVSERLQKDLHEDYTINNNGDLTALYEKVAKALETVKQ